MTTVLPNTTTVGNMCEATINLVETVQLPFVLITLLVNFILLAAAIFDKKRLQRQNYMFVCVNSTLLSHIVFLSLSVWEITAQYGKSNVPEIPMQLTPMKYIWTVCEASLVSIRFGMVANAASLVHMCLESVYFAGRNAPEILTSSHSGSSEITGLNRRKRVCDCLITLSWLLPFLFTLLVTLWWNCAEMCRCPTGIFAGDNCPFEYGCSRLVPPMKGYFLFLNICAWLITIIVLVILVARKMKQHKNSLKSSVKKTKTPLESKSDVNLSNGKQPAMALASLNAGEASTELSRRHRKSSKFEIRPSSKFTIAVVLTALLLGCFLPESLVIVIDLTIQDINAFVPKLILSSTAYFYTFACPIIMVIYLPTLKSALIKLLESIRTCSFFSKG